MKGAPDTGTFNLLKDRYDELQQMANVGSWEWDVPTNTVSWSDELFKVFDVDPKDFQPTYEWYLERIHPEDRHIVDKAVKDCFMSPEHIPFHFDNRVILRNGDIRWVNGKGRAILDDKGNVIKMIGSAQDMTERRNIEDELDKRAKEAESLNKMLLDRENQMVKLKEELAAMKKKK